MANVEELTEAIEFLAACLDKWEDCPRINCMCAGCTDTIPFWWVAGMCRACCSEDCEHEEGG